MKQRLGAFWREWVFPAVMVVAVLAPLRSLSDNPALKSMVGGLQRLLGAVARQPVGDTPDQRRPSASSWWFLGGVSGADELDDADHRTGGAQRERDRRARP